MADLEHGGNLSQATSIFGEPAQGWVDLSTGINPSPYPLPPQILAQSASWQRLPEPDGLEKIATEYYASPYITALPGSQTAISLLPALRRRSRVAIPEPEYAEHARAWQSWGHDVYRIAPRLIANGPSSDFDFDVLVLSNPNNPTALLYPPEMLLAWHNRMHHNNGWLIVDEAFADSDPGFSLAPYTGREGLIVLRSLGKFFGLAGARVGFLLAPHGIRNRISAFLGPWPLAGPSRQIAAAALTDTAWQQEQRASLASAAERLAEILNQAGLKVAGKTSLYCWINTDSARVIQQTLATRGIWLRGFDHPPGLRLGLPGRDEEWHRLIESLKIIG